MALRAAAQDRGIAGLEAQRAGIGGHVRPAFVDDADDAERHAHALDGHAVGPRPALRHACRPGSASARTTVDARPPLPRPRSHRARVGRERLCWRRTPWPPRGRAHWPREYRPSRARHLLRHGAERRILLAGRCEREHARCLPRLRPDITHQHGEIVRVLEGLCRRAHLWLLFGFLGDILNQAVTYHVAAGPARPPKGLALCLSRLDASLDSACCHRRWRRSRGRCQT